MSYTIIIMIKSYAHKGLEKFAKTGNSSGIQAKHAKKLRLILARLDIAETVEEINFPGANLHQLKGNKKELWSVKVNGNWRITFKFENGDVYIVNYVDYH